MEVIIENFLAIRKAKIKVEGLTVLKGASSSGKSSIIRAISESVTNRFLTNRVRYGCQEACIKFRMGGSNSPVLVIVKKNQGSPDIVLKHPDGRVQQFSKIARTVPKEVEEFFGFGQVQVSNEKVSLSVFPQHQAPFLLSFSQKRVMEILSSSVALDDFHVALKSLNTRKIELNGVYQHQVALQSSLKDKEYKERVQLEYLEPLYNQVKLNVSLYEATQEKLSRLRDFSSQLSDKETVINSLRACVDCDRALSVVYDIESRREHLSEIQQQYSEHLTGHDSIRVLNKQLEEVDKALSFNKVYESTIKSSAFVNSLLAYVRKKEESIVSLDLLQRKESFYNQALSSSANVDKAKTSMIRVSKYVSLINEKNSLSSLMEELSKVIDDKECPFCKSKLKEDMTTPEIEEKRREITNKIQSLRERLAVIESALKKGAEELGIPMTQEALKQYADKLKKESDEAFTAVENALAKVDELEKGDTKPEVADAMPKPKVTSSTSVQTSSTDEFSESNDEF